MFEKGCLYTRDEIHELVGGGVQPFLPEKNGKVVAGCFCPEQNPNAPLEIDVEEGSRRQMSALRAASQPDAFPVFLKVEAKAWRYVGMFKGKSYAEYDSDTNKFTHKNNRIAGVLRLTQME